MKILDPAALPPLSDGTVSLRLTTFLPAEPLRRRAPTYAFAIEAAGVAGSVGRCDLRVGMNPDLFISGNIGYRVWEPFRGRGYATRACRLLLSLAQTLEMPRVVITCRPDNTASRRICEALGARFSGIVPVPRSHELYAAGDREECRYIFRFDALC